ncbi:MAG TPA: histidinol dehydrogenase [Vicinamibacterales bacterium]|nr:histidinol dehydrogenase [Vicinamibacterales bacterium]
MRVIGSDNAAALARLIGAGRAADERIARRVRRIVADVRRRGDAALRAYATALDGLPPGTPLLLDRTAIVAGSRGIAADLRRAIALAASHVERVARASLPSPRTVRVAAGVRVELRTQPLARVGCYVPGGRHPLVSSLLMTAIPARVAGVRDITVACPRPVPAVLCAARLAGVSRVLRAGGAQAIAALAYGTATVPRVDKIAGPGNAYVSAAKALVAPDCAIDFHAGPTELVMIASRADAGAIAADLVAQAEHDPAARAILLTTSRALAREVAARVAALARPFGAAAVSVRRNGAAVVTRSLDEAIRIADRIAPEHLWCEDDRVAAAVRNAGTIFVGAASIPALGDYVTGSNHVLPTAGAARARGGLSAADFVKTISVQRVTRRGLAALRGPGTLLARAEGLEAHARSIEEER